MAISRNECWLLGKARILLCAISVVIYFTFNLYGAAGRDPLDIPYGSNTSGNRLNFLARGIDSTNHDSIAGWRRARLEAAVFSGEGLFEDIRTLNRRIASLTAERDSLTARLSVAKTTRGEAGASGDAQATLRADTERLSENLRAAEAERDEARASVTALQATWEAERTGLQGEIEALRRNLTEIAAFREQLRGELDRERAETAGLRETLGHQREEAEALGRRQADALRELNAQLARLRAENDDLSGRLRAAEAEMGEARAAAAAQHAALRAELARLNSDRERLLENLRAAERTRDNAIAEATAAKKAAEAWEAERTTLRGVLEADEGESLVDAARRLHEIGKGSLNLDLIFKAVEDPSWALSTVQGEIRAHPIYGRSKAKELDVRNISATYAAVSRLQQTEATDHHSKSLLQGISSSLGVPIDGLSRLINALRPAASITEGVRHIRVGSSTVNTDILAILASQKMPDGKPIISDAEHPTLTDILQALAESVREYVYHEKFDKGHDVKPEELKAWLSDRYGLR